MGYVQGVYDLRNYDSLDALLNVVYGNMPNNYAKVILIADNAGTTWGGSSYFAVIKRVDAEYGVVDFVSYDNSGTALRKALFNGVWLPLEWGNPPMFLGVEYRTTERYLGKPVYTKAVDCGLLPDTGGMKSVTFYDAATSGSWIDYAYTGNRGRDFPWVNENGLVAAVNVNGNTIVLYNYLDSTGTSNVIAVVKYTKATD